jgi:hypothetical protein
VTSTSVRPRAQGACLSRLPGKRARPVVRGDRCSNAAVLPDELFFSALTRRVLRHGDFTSRDDLIDKLESYAVKHNDTAKPYRWTYEGTPLKAALISAPPRTNAEQH